MFQSPAYNSTAAASERVAWRLDDVLTEDDRFDFSRPFLPERLVGARELTFLSPDERIVLNQIRAHGYLTLFGLAGYARVDFRAGEERYLLVTPRRRALRMEWDTPRARRRLEEF